MKNQLGDLMQQAQKMGYSQPLKGSNQKSPLIAYVLCGVKNIDEYYTNFLNILQNIALHDNRVTVFMTTTSDMKSIRQVMYSIDSFKPLGIILHGYIPCAMVFQFLRKARRRI